MQPKKINLFDLKTAGMGAKMAKAEGLPVEQCGRINSRIVALRDLERLEEYEGHFLACAIKYDIPGSLLAAICSRETHGLNIVGDNGHGRGLMQIDDRFHEIAKTIDVMDHGQNIEYGSQLLADYWRIIRQSLSWPPVVALLGAVAAYNSGISNVRTIARLDVGTTNGDYSSDVWARAQAFEKRAKAL
jgi:membrane-bound lytic murein transglycosylase MltF